jgi:hypothetical protein
LVYEGQNAGGTLQIKKGPNQAFFNQKILVGARGFEPHDHIEKK